MINQIVQVSALELLTSLETGSVGAIISDPPFFINVGRMDNWSQNAGFGHGSLEGEQEVSSVDAAVKWTLPHAQQAYRVLRRGGSLVVMGGSQSLAAWELAASRSGLSWMAEITVLWNTGKPRARNFGSLATAIRWYVKPGTRHAFHAGDVRSIYSNVLVAKKVPIDARVHPAQKPVEITTFLCSLLTDEDDTVVDPFCGAGSTLVSAIYCERSYLGADIDSASVIAAEKRVRKALMGEDEPTNPLYLWINNKLIPVEG